MGFFIGLAFGLSGGDATIVPWISGLIGFFGGAAIYGAMIKHPETGPIGFVKGILISLFLLAVLIVIGLIVVGLIAILAR